MEIYDAFPCAFGDVGFRRFCFRRRALHSIIEREYNRGSVEFPSSERLVKEISNVIAKENHTGNQHLADPNDWLYLSNSSIV
jgi:hypothetical protein